LAQIIAQQAAYIPAFMYLHTVFYPQKRLARLQKHSTVPAMVPRAVNEVITELAHPGPIFQTLYLPLTTPLAL
jgi:hypothetical protein